MPQGKMKAKAQVPKSVAAKKKAKGRAVTKRGNAPVTPKKAKQVQAQKLKKVISKTVNAVAEEELRAIAVVGKNHMTKVSPKAAPKAKKTKAKKK